MLGRLRQILIEPPPVYEVGVLSKSRLLAIFLLAMIVVFVGVDITYVLTVPGYVVPWYGYVFLLTAFLLNRLPYYRVSAWLVVLMFPAVVFSTIIGGTAALPAVMLTYLAAGLILAGILLTPVGVMVFALCNGIGILLLPSLAPQVFPDFGSVIGPFSVFAIASVLVIVSMFHRDRVETDRQALLRQSEERYRMLFEESPDGICIVSGDNKILAANQALLSMMGYSLEELIGRSPDDFVAPENVAERALRPLDAFKVPGTLNHDRVVMRSDGRRLNVIIRSTFLPNGNLQFIIQDFTERKRIEKALRDSEDKFARAFQSSPDAVTISSIATGKFVEVNDGFCRISGYTREEALGHSGEELHIWDNMEQRRIMVGKLQAEGGVRDFETVLRRKSGEPLNCLLSVEAIEIGGEKCMVIITRDVTEQKQAEAALRQNELRWRAMLEAVPDMVFELKRDGSITRFIPSAHNELNLRPETLIGKRIAEVMPAIAEQTAFALERALDSGQLHAFEFGIDVQGEHKTFEVRITPAGQELVLVMLRDVTLNKWSATERENLIAELEQKNAELERFTYTVSHDLKSPIITIRGFLGFVYEDAKSGNIARLEKDMQRISDATEKMQQLLADLLELSRVGRINHKPTHISTNELIDEVVELLHGRLTPGAVEVCVTPDLPPIYGDRARIFEIFQNLIDNAAKFMGDQLNPQIDIGVNGELDGNPVFYVRDNGMGIPRQFRDRVFGLFDKLDPLSEGTGIGLALVKRIVEFHGGTIWVESEVGKGTSFFFSLPQSKSG